MISKMKLMYIFLCSQEIRKDIINSVDTDGDGFISQEEFLQLAKGRNIPGFNRRRRRAFRELLKQTVEFIVPYKYQYTVRKCFRIYGAGMHVCDMIDFISEPVFLLPSAIFHAWHQFDSDCCLCLQ